MKLTKKDNTQAENVWQKQASHFGDKTTARIGPLQRLGEVSVLNVELQPGTDYDPEPI